MVEQNKNNCSPFDSEISSSLAAYLYSTTFEMKTLSFQFFLVYSFVFDTYNEIKRGKKYVNNSQT